MVRLGSKLSMPWPSAPHEKKSASMYSRFSGNSRRSTSVFGSFSLDATTTTTTATTTLKNKLLLLETENNAMMNNR